MPLPDPCMPQIQSRMTKFEATMTLREALLPQKEACVGNREAIMVKNQSPVTPWEACEGDSPSRAAQSGASILLARKKSRWHHPLVDAHNRAGQLCFSPLLRRRNKTASPSFCAGWGSSPVFLYGTRPPHGLEAHATLRLAKRIRRIMRSL